ncbi:MAG: hypothetical protein NTW21_08355 [Verrucomicrobia bacterium]|nr:hypothetical protein [Verrucomicrobiota bacterium]
MTSPANARAEKIRHWRLYVAHNSHQDIGYTDYQENLRTKTWPSFWDQALLKYMPDSDTWQDDAKVRLEVEGTYQLDGALTVRSADWFETLRTRLRQGRFAYGAALGDLAQSNWGAEELARSTYYADRSFKDKTGVGSTRNVIMRDEPTMSWGVIDALVDAGAKSLVLQHNYDHNLWRGTVFYPELLYAEGKSPSIRLLVWNAPLGSYSIDELEIRDDAHYFERPEESRGRDPAVVTDIMNRISAKLMGYQSTECGKCAAACAVDRILGKHDQGCSAIPKW